MLLAVGGLSLIVRRRYPVAVLAVTLVTALWAGEQNAAVVWLALIVAFFTAVLARKRAAAVASLVIGYVASVWPPWLIGQPGHATVGFALGLAAGLMVLLSVAEVIRIRNQRAAAVKRGREEEQRRRASEERMRMARDLHDVVAHNISVINVQANTALHLMDRQPERARSALVTINDVSKQALVELRSVLGVLRDVDESAPRAPAPGLARLGDLVDHAAAAGLTVRTEQDGPPGPAARRRRPGRVPDRPGGAHQQRPPLRRQAGHGAPRLRRRCPGDRGVATTARPGRGAPARPAAQATARATASPA